MARDINLLHPKIKQLAGKLKAECEKAGLPILITETWRTKTEQDALYAKGRTKTGNIVTNAKYPQSQHCWGTAFDFCRNVKGREFDDSDGFFGKVGKVGKSLGLEWGGDWKNPVDKPHFQLKGTEYNWRTLQTKHGTPEKYKATWTNTKIEELKMDNTRNETAIAEAKTIIGKLGKIIEISGVNTAVLQLADNYNNSVWWILKKIVEKYIG